MPWRAMGAGSCAQNVNVAQFETLRLYARGTFQSTYLARTEALGACVIGATVFETKAGYTRGAYDFHDGIDEKMPASAANRGCAI